MKILVTGANGFIGRNLTDRLKAEGAHEIYEFTRETPLEQLDAWCADCEFVFHLAGVNRPDNDSEFMRINCGLTEALVEYLGKYKNICPLLYTSSVQAELDNEYGKSKAAAEMVLQKRDTKTYIYRLPNVFGKWTRPNYNSVVATFCYNTANGLPLRIDDENKQLSLVYIDDVVSEFVRALNGCARGEVTPVYNITLGKMAEMLGRFKESRDTKFIPYMSGFEKKLYAMYTSYLPEDGFDYSVDTHADERGSFTELFKSEERGQVSVNIIKPHIVKGNHYHHTKNEKFVVVSGSGVIRFRRVGTEKVVEYKVSGDNIRIVDIPCGYTHNIENTGEGDMVVVMWCNECFDPENPDTYFLKV